MRLLLKLIVVVMITGLLLSIGAVSAQDTDPLAPTNTTSVAPITVASTSIPEVNSPVGEQPVIDDPVPLPSPNTDEIRMSMAQLIAGIFGAIALGVIAGGGTALAVIGSIIRNISQNSLLKDAMEKLYLSTPPQTQLNVREGAVTMKQIGDLLDEVTDGLPNTPGAAPPAVAAAG